MGGRPREKMSKRVAGSYKANGHLKGREREREKSQYSPVGGHLLQSTGADTHAAQMASGGMRKRHEHVTRHPLLALRLPTGPSLVLPVTAPSCPSASRGAAAQALHQRPHPVALLRSRWPLPHRHRGGVGEIGISTLGSIREPQKVGHFRDHRQSSISDFKL